MTFKELDKIKTLLQKDYTPKGAEGVIVCVFTSPDIAYMVEFTNEDGETLDTPIYLPTEIAKL